MEGTNDGSPTAAAGHAICESPKPEAICNWNRTAVGLNACNAVLYGRRSQPFGWAVFANSDPDEKPPKHLHSARARVEECCASSPVWLHVPHTTEMIQHKSLYNAHPDLQLDGEGPTYIGETLKLLQHSDYVVIAVASPIVAAKRRKSAGIDLAKAAERV